MEYPMSTVRHSLAHILAQAIQRSVDADVQLGIGPDIDNGFYYDFLFSEGVEFGESQLKPTQKVMQKIIKENQSFVYYETDAAESATILDMFGQHFKKELLERFQEEKETKITYYLNTIKAAAVDALLRDASDEFKAKYKVITDYFTAKIPELEGQFVVFADMCEGPHVQTTKEIPEAYHLDKLAGAYWKGDAENDMMVRVYGLAFETKQELKDYQAMMEEAKKRDHRVLGKQLKLFTMSEKVGSGLPLLQPNGMILRQEIENYLWEMHRKQGYERVWTPHITKQNLYETSGHWEKFGDELFKVQGKEECFCMKPMNCPHHMQIFADNQFSYRDMPVKYFEPGTVYRDEKTGQLSGLTRVRAITQDDGHLFCRPDQLQEEVGNIVAIIRKFYSTIGMMDDYWVSLSVRGEDKSKYLGGDDVWDIAEAALEEAAEENKLNYKKIEGEAAFYGPKLDFMFKDCLGREWQLATIQADFNLPERFDLSYTNADGEKERPVVVHRAISGSLERFMGIMIEHFAGAFPVWLAPKQAIILPVADKFTDYAQQLRSDMMDKDLRAEVDTSGESLGKMIRNAELRKIPYILIVGEQEVNDKTVSVREYSSKKQYTMDAAQFVTETSDEYQQRLLDHPDRS